MSYRFEASRFSYYISAISFNCFCIIVVWSCIYASMYFCCMNTFHIMVHDYNTFCLDVNIWYCFDPKRDIALWQIFFSNRDPDLQQVIGYSQSSSVYLFISSPFSLWFSHSFCRNTPTSSFFNIIKILQDVEREL